MTELERSVQTSSSACPRCGSTRTVTGTVFAEGEMRFVPRGMRWWKLRRGAPLMPEPVQGCLDCGCVTASVDPSELRATIRRAGGDELKSVLNRSRPAGS